MVTLGVVVLAYFVTRIYTRTPPSGPEPKILNIRKSAERMHVARHSMKEPPPAA